ncbi:centromere protein S [Syncephalis plumigaleata]|nr:centromere protein S [Syncephalis plumigaleata]
MDIHSKTRNKPVEEPSEEQRRQQLKAAIWYTVGKICHSHESKIQLTITPQFIAALSEIVYYHMVRLGKDLEMFAQHAGRNMIKVDDVKLCARRNPEMAHFIQQMIDEQKGPNDNNNTEHRPRGRKRKTETEAAVMDDV